MTFKEKIDKLLISNDKKINSVAGLELFLGLSAGSISKSYRKNGEPGLKVIKIIMERLGINETWWRSGKGDIFGVKPTSEGKVSEPMVGYNDKQLIIETLNKALDAKDQLIEVLNEKIQRLEADREDVKKVRSQ